MEIGIFILYLLIGLLIHLSLFYWVLKGKHLRWPDGVLTAALVSSVLYIIHVYFWLLLMIFFISSTLLTHYRSVDKTEVQLIFEKGGERDRNQVLANSIGILIFSIIQLLNGVQIGINLILIVGTAIFVSSMNSDTWATELGILSTSEPRLILNFWKKVPPGTSGGVTLLGSLSAFLGALIIACFAGLYYWIQETVLNPNLLSIIDILGIIIIITFFGFLGQIIDSIIGATVQANYICHNCKKVVESSFHKSCGVKTYKHRGFHVINNDVVNLASGLIAVLIGCPIFLFF